MFATFHRALLFLVCCAGASLTYAQQPEKFDISKFLATLHEEPAPIKAEDLFTLVEPKRDRLSMVCFSRDAAYVAAMFDGNYVYIWDTKTGLRVSPVNYKAPGRITSLALSSDGKYVLIGREKDNALLGNSFNVKVEAIYKGFISAARVAAVSSDDKYALFFEQNGDILRFPLMGGDPLRISKAAEDIEEYHMCRFTPDGKQAIVSGSRLKKVRLITLPEEEGQEVKSVSFATEYATSAAVLGGDYLIFNHSGQLCFRNRPDKSGLTGWLQTLPADAFWIDLSEDGKRLTTTRHNGIVNMRGMVAPGLSNKVSLGMRLRECAIASDGRTLALLDEQGRLFLKRLPEEFESPALRISRTLQQLLAEKDYEGLEAIFQQCQKDTTPFSWASNRTPYNELCRLLATPPGAPLKYGKINEAINAWAKARPQAVPPKIMQAQEEIRLAWQNRGSGTADTVTLFGAIGFEARIKRAEALIVPVCDAEAPPPFAFQLLFTVSMAQQWDDDRLEPYVEKLLSLSPRAIDAHFAMAMALLPRWGGAPEDLNDYAERVAEAVGGEEADGIYSRFAMAQHFLHPPQHLFRGTGLDYQRTLRGLQYLGNKAPDGKTALCFGAWIAVQQADNEALKLFCEKLKDEDLALVWPEELWRYEGDQRTIQTQIAALKKATP